MQKSQFLLIGLFISISVFSQTEMPKPQADFNGFHKNIFIEGFGANLITGINYDMRLQRGRMDGIGFRTGIGGAIIGVAFEDGNNPSNWHDYGYGGFYFANQEKGYATTIPMEINYLIGKRKSSFLMGVGILPFFLSVPSKDFNKLVLGAGYFSLGYRLQPLRNGFMFQVNWNPLISQGEIIPQWFGISFGFGFK